MCSLPLSSSTTAPPPSTPSEQPVTDKGYMAAIKKPANNRTGNISETGSLANANASSSVRPALEPFREHILWNIFFGLTALHRQGWIGTETLQHVKTELGINSLRIEERFAQEVLTSFATTIQNQPSRAPITIAPAPVPPLQTVYPLIQTLPRIVHTASATPPVYAAVYQAPLLASGQTGRMVGLGGLDGSGGSGQIANTASNTRVPTKQEGQTVKSPRGSALTGNQTQPTNTAPAATTSGASQPLPITTYQPPVIPTHQPPPLPTRVPYPGRYATPPLAAPTSTAPPLAESTSAPSAPPSAPTQQQPSLPLPGALTPGQWAIAIGSFKGGEAGDLVFKQGDVVQILKNVDDNWYEGTCNGQTGIFPKNHVKPRDDGVLV
ncbi:Neutrophil cytosol factor 2 [Rhizophlyctis rosea]|uniref:Neutrophil cytosol factor 2 n=1 Tax=Rhizophlyctis rosea TaxID=64517 RepID=A0AAD5WY46_9FUNG|nr:Neutrophil cytosol factor 2 [Rhizophlyctis rosea]